MNIKYKVVLGSLVLLLAPLFNFRAAWSNSYPAGLQRAQASRAIALLMCTNVNGQVSIRAHRGSHHRRGGFLTEGFWPRMAGLPGFGGFRPDDLGAWQKRLKQWQYLKKRSKHLSNAIYHLIGLIKTR